MKTKLVTILGIALVAGCATLLGCFIIVCRTAAAEPPKVAWQKDPAYQQLLRERVESASQLFQAEKRRSDIGKNTIDAVYLAAERLRDARLDLGAQPETVIRTEHLALMRDMEKAEKSKVSFNPEPIDRAMELARYWRSSAEIDLVRAQNTSVAR